MKLLERHNKEYVSDFIHQMRILVIDICTENQLSFSYALEHLLLKDVPKKMVWTLAKDDSYLTTSVHIFKMLQNSSSELKFFILDLDSLMIEPATFEESLEVVKSYKAHSNL